MRATGSYVLIHSVNEDDKQLGKLGLVVASQDYKETAKFMLGQVKGVGEEVGENIAKVGDWVVFAGATASSVHKRYGEDLYLTSYTSILFIADVDQETGEILDVKAVGKNILIKEMTYQDMLIQKGSKIILPNQSNTGFNRTSTGKIVKVGEFVDQTKFKVGDMVVYGSLSAYPFPPNMSKHVDENLAILKDERSILMVLEEGDL